MEIYENLWKSLKIYENRCKPLKIYEHLWKSMKIYGSPWNPWTWMGYICLEKRRWVISYILRIWTPHISVIQREIIRLNIKNENWAFQENMDFGLQITYQSYYFDEHLKWSHGHYGHFAPTGFIGNTDRSSVFDKGVESDFFQQSGAQFGVYIRRFNIAPVAISMTIRSGSDWHGPTNQKMQKIKSLY